MRNLRFLILAFVLSSFSLNAQNSPAPIKLVQLVLTPNHADWNYHCGEKAIINIQVLKFGVPIKNAEIEYSYGPEIIKPSKKGTLSLKKGIGQLVIGTLKDPGFLQLKVQIKYDGYTYKDEVKVAFDANLIQPTVKKPDDFDHFWQKAMEQNKRVPMEPLVTFMPEYSTSSVNVYLVRLQNYQRGKYIYGYLCKPTKEGKYPVLFNPPGAGIKKIKPYTGFAEQGFISFAIEIHGISPEVADADYKNIRKAFNDYWFIKLDDKDNYYYKSVYLGCVRSINFLTEVKEFNGKDILVTGGSQGGALSIVTAGLSDKVTALASFYPALCDLTGYLNNRAGGWPHTFSDRYSEWNNTPEKIETASYYDVVNFARKIKVPGFYSFGYNDHTCPPTSVMSALNVINAPKEIIVTPISGHWRFGETNSKSIQFLKSQCEK